MKLLRSMLVTNFGILVISFAAELRRKRLRRNVLISPNKGADVCARTVVIAVSPYVKDVQIKTAENADCEADALVLVFRFGVPDFLGQRPFTPWITFFVHKTLDCNVRQGFSKGCSEVFSLIPASEIPLSQALRSNVQNS